MHRTLCFGADKGHIQLLQVHRDNDRSAQITGDTHKRTVAVAYTKSPKDVLVARISHYRLRNIIRDLLDFIVIDIHG